MKVMTLSQLDTLAEAKQARIRLRAEDAAAIGGDAASARKRKGGSGAPTASVGVEIAGSEAFSGGKTSAANRIDNQYLLWGFSQKVQIAGVLALARSDTLERFVVALRFLLHSSVFLRLSARSNH